MPIEFPNPLYGARERLARDLEKLEGQVKGMKQIIANIDAELAASRMNENGSEELPLVIPGQYTNMRIGRALESYLKARPGSKIPIAKVVEDLLAGGANLGSRHQQNLKITMRQKGKLVKWDENWTMWLASAASEPKPPSNAKKR